MLLKKTEKDIVDGTDVPNTVESLKGDFHRLGVIPGSIIIMHCSLSKIGWVIGGPVALIRALLEVITPNGILIMPTFSGDNSEPSYWVNPPVPDEWWALVRNSMPGYNPEVTPTRGLGIVPEVFRKWPKVIRSMHPNLSFAAWGKRAKSVIRDHEIGVDLGENSPLARIYNLNGNILLIGVNHENNTSLHLAEYRSNFQTKRMRLTGAATEFNNRREWKVWEELDINNDDFEKLGEEFESSHEIISGKVGMADAKLISVKEMVDFAVGWFTKNRRIDSKS